MRGAHFRPGDRPVDQSLCEFKLNGFGFNPATKFARLLRKCASPVCWRCVFTRLK